MKEEQEKIYLPQQILILFKLYNFILLYFSMMTNNFVIKLY